ncbi:hypothetical protein ANRL3_00684 [Anaerolineae bacterium]|nr:hypothetical protein ANRL3_00684 [Anaerolineae bacterium]
MANSSDSLMQDWPLVIEFSQAREAGNGHTWLGAHVSVGIVSALVNVLHHYGSDDQRAIIIPALADLAGHARYVRDVFEHLGQTDEGREVLEEIVFVEPLDRLIEDANTAAEARQYATQLRNLRQRRPRWLKLWSKPRPTDPSPLSDWLHTVDLQFNPFGPEHSELDDRLPDYAVFDHVDLIRGLRPALILGEPGSGRTATAFLLAHECDDPPEAPRESGVLPAYCSVPFAPRSRDAACRYLEALARAVARAVLRLLAVRPRGWLDLPTSQQREAMGALLLTCAGSKEVLVSELRRVAPDPAYRRLMPMVEHLQAVCPADRLGEAGWLDLLAGAIPFGFQHIYALVDVKDSQATDAVIGSFHTLADLAVPLAASGVYLKAFVPAALRRSAMSLTGFNAGFNLISLVWNEQSLIQMLGNRFGRAGGEGLLTVCGPDVPGDIETQFVRAALLAPSPPRQLVRMGNHLLYRHAQFMPDKSMISADEVEWVLSANKRREDEGKGDG